MIGTRSRCMTRSVSRSRPSLVSVLCCPAWFAAWVRARSVLTGSPAACRWRRARRSGAGVPEPVEVVLSPADVEGQRVLLEQAEASERAFEAVDGAGGGREDLVQPVGRVVVGRSFGKRIPLLAFAAPVE